MNPWFYPYEKSRGVIKTLITHYKNLKVRLATTATGDLIMLLNLTNYPGEGEITEKVQEILSLMPDENWPNQIYWLHHTKIKRIVELLVELDVLIETAFREYK